MKKVKTILCMLSVAWLIMTGITACEQKLEYKVYTNAQLPYTFEVPATWMMDDSIPGIVKFYNAEKSMGINCEVGSDALVPEENLDNYCDWDLKRHKSDINNNEQELVKANTHYILKWRDDDGVYYIDGGKCVNGYLGGIRMVSDSITQMEAYKIFEHVFGSISSNPDFEEPEDTDEED